MKKFFLSLFLLVGIGMTAMAQKEQAIAPYTFVGVQGGMQNTYNTQFPFGRTWSPTATVSVGHFFNKDLGLRLSINGSRAKSNAPFIGAATKQFKYNQLTTSADLLVNAASIFTNKKYSRVNFYIIGGFGFNYDWDNDEALSLYNQGANLLYADQDHKRGMNIRMGGQLEVNITKAVAFNMEATYNYLTNQRQQKFVEDRSQLVVQAGFNFKFNYKKKKEKVQAAEPLQLPEAPVATETEKTVYIYYSLRNSSATNNEEAKVAEVAEWLKAHPTAKAVVTGYADKQTGNPTLNMSYSQKRAQAVTDSLVKRHGISASRITTEAKGDTVQPFAENDANRVVIVIAKE